MLRTLCGSDSIISVPKFTNLFIIYVGYNIAPIMLTVMFSFGFLGYFFDSVMTSTEI